MDKKNILQIVKDLTIPGGISGREDDLRSAALKYLEPLGNVSVSPLGSLICKVCENKESDKNILIEAHLDRIGLVVTSVLDNGFLRIGTVGGFDKRTFPAAPVTIFAESGKYNGVICSVPPHLNDGEEKPKKTEEFAIDTGFSTEEAKKIFKEGDEVIFNSRFAELLGDRITSAALDNRIGCASIIAAAQEIKNKAKCNVTLMLSVQEETSGIGAATAAYGIKPTEAIVVDVSFARGYGVKPVGTSPMGSGVMVGFAPILSRSMSVKMRTIAENKNIPHTIEVMNGRTGTNSDGIVLARDGVPAVLLSIPLRCMHTVTECIDLKDAAATAELIAEYVKEAE